MGAFNVTTLGDRARSVKYTPINAATLDGTTTTQVAIIPFEGRHSLGLQWTWTSTLTATIGLEVSSNYDARRPTEARWTTVTDATITAYLGAAAPPGGKPSGTAGSAYLLIDPLRCAAVRFTATRTASSGVITLDVEAS